MTSREGINRSRLRQTAPITDQVLTPLGRTIPSIPNSLSINPITSTSVPTTVVQTSGTIRARHHTNPSNNTNTNANNNNNSNPTELETNSIIDIGIIDTNLSTPVLTFDAEQFRADIKSNHHDNKRLEQLVLNAINYFLTTSKRSSQQIADYTVLTFLAWTVSIHGEIFRLPSVLKAMCILLKGSTITKTMKSLPIVNNGNNNNNNNNNNSTMPTTTPYTLICHILWLAYKDQTNWPDEFLEAYVEDALGEQNWIKNPDCQLFVSNIQTAFHTRPSTWNIDRSKIFPSSIPTNTITTPTSQILSNLNDDLSNDSNNNNNNDALIGNESESSIQTMDEQMINNNNNNNNNNNSDNQLIYPRYEGRLPVIQQVLQTLLTTNAKIKSTTGNSTNLNPANSSTATANTSQPHETDKLLYLLEHLCGLPEIRLYILSRLDIWLQNPKLTRTSEKLMITLCENLTKPPANIPNNTTLTNGHLNNNNDTSYIDERAIEQLVNLRFKVRASNVTNKMYILCIREMLKNDANLVDLIVRFTVHNELQQIPSTTATIITTTSKNPNNLPLLHACFQSQPEHSCQSLAYTIQNILLSTNVTTTSKDYENLLRLIRPFLRDLLRYAKNDFDSMRFSMYLIDMHYSNNLQQQFWNMVQQQDLPSNEITSNRLLKRLRDCDMCTRERFLTAVCDLIPMIILASAQAFNSSNNPTTNPNLTTTRLSSSSSSTMNNDQWLLFIQRIAFIQCSSCLFFLYTLPHLFDATPPINYVQSLYNILFTAQVNSYLRFENWPSEEPIGLRNDLFRLSSEIPLLGETLYLLIQIGLISSFRISPSTIVDLIDLIVRRTLNVEQKMSNDYISTYLRIPENSCELFLKNFFDLTCYHIPTQTQFPSNYEKPKNLSITEIFWKTCLICLLLASHDPQVFGKYIWLNIPQIRLFMEMLLTEKFYLNEKVQLRQEKDLILELEKYLASPKIIDETNSQLLGKIICLNLQQIKRPTTHDKNEKNFYNLIQGFNNTYKLSSMLCRCRSPDFILDILNRKEQQDKNIFHSQTSWLTSLIDSNIDCLNVFPIICLCDYFQHMILIYNKQNLPAKKTLHALETILNRFKSIFHTVKQQISTNIQKSPQIDDLICIFNYFFNCLNSKISKMRSNTWLCLYIILHDLDHPSNLEHLLSKFDQLPDINIDLILTNIAQFKSLNKTQSLIKQTLTETCQSETNIHLLHNSILFIINNSSINSHDDQLLLSNLSRGLIHRHSILYLLIQYDKKDKNSQLISKYFHFISLLLIKNLSNSLKSPIEINSTENFDEQLSTNTQTYLILPSFNQDFLNLIKQLENLVNVKHEYSWNINTNKQYIQIDSILVEFLIIFLAYFDYDNEKNKQLNQIANLLQKLLFNQNPTLCFTTLKQFNIPMPVKQTQEEVVTIDDNDENHFKQFAIEDTEPIENPRKRRLSQSNSTEKVFITSSTKPIYRLVPINDKTEQSLFLSDDLQYFIFKSNHFNLVKQCIDQASFLTCLKMFKISVISHENINYLCQRLNQLIDSSSKQIHTYIKQSSFLLPLINRWIIEKLPEAIKLGEKLKKLLEKKKKSHSTTQDSVQQSHLIPTTSRSSLSITDQIQSFNHRINDLCNKTSLNNSSNDNQMDTSEINENLSWKNINDCEQLLKYLFNKNNDPIKRRQLLLQLQLLTNVSDHYRLQLFQTVLKCCQSTYKDEFLDNLYKQTNISLVLLNILIKNQPLDNDYKTLINLFDRSDIHDEKNLFQMKLKEIQENLINQSETLTFNNISDLLNHSSSSNNSKLEEQFSKSLRLNYQNEDEREHFLINLLVQTEHRLSEPAIGMILDQLEKLDYQSSRSSNSSIYSHPFLFSQRTHSSLSQRLLLKQFLHSCNWSTILTTIADLLTLKPSTQNSISINSITNHNRLIPTDSLKQSRFSLINNRDSTLILDMLEAFIKLSPLWAGRESKMLERCHDEFLIDFNLEHIYTLIIYILDEGDRYSHNKDQLYHQYQKRYENLLYHLIKIRDKKFLFKKCLEKIFIDFQTIDWIKDLLKSFYLIIYVNQSDLFPENFHLIFSDYQQLNSLQTNYNSTIHDLLIRLNSYDLISMENFKDIYLLLKESLTKNPILFLRYLTMIKFNLQSRLSTITQDEYHQKHSKQRYFFLSSFDLIYSLKPYIYEQIYEQDFQTIIDIYIRLITMNLHTLNPTTKQNIFAMNYFHDYIYLIDKLLDLIYNYLYTTIHNRQHYGLFKIYNNKFFEKIQEKIQINKDLSQVLLSKKNNQILYRLTQLKMLYEAIKIEDTTDSTSTLSNEIIPFDVRLCLVDRTLSENSSKVSSDVSLRHRSIDIQQYINRLSHSVDEYTSSTIIDDILFVLNELKSHIDNSIGIDRIELIIDILTNYLLSGNKQLIDQTYELILKYIEKFPQQSIKFYSTYMKCLLSNNSIVFQTALQHFSHFIIYFQSKSNELFSLLLKQGLINKIDVTSSITQAIRLLNLHRYDPITYSNLTTSSSSSTTAITTTAITTTIND